MSIFVGILFVDWNSKYPTTTTDSNSGLAAIRFETHSMHCEIWLEYFKLNLKHSECTDLNK